MKTSKDGLQLIKDFEGLELNAYNVLLAYGQSGMGILKVCKKA
jgi:GH24 family phage-related lysozyme (muramidase)